MPDDRSRACRVLVVDDHAPTRLLVSMSLVAEGYETIEAEDAMAAVHHLAQSRPDLVLLDLNLPGIGGMELLDRLRQTSDLPVVVLSGRALAADRVAALRAGADDYLVKPFAVDELLARVESVLRRSRPLDEPADPVLTHVLRFEGLEIDLATRTVTVGTEPVELTAREFDLLAFLAAAPRQVFSRSQLLQQVWGSRADWQGPATVTEHVRRVRRKIEVDPDHPRFIQTVRNVGYRFQP
jgi:DNA-binding response OmpR family regulator